MGIFASIKAFWNQVGLLILGCQCRNFWEEFPKEDKPGPWMAVAIRSTPFSRREVLWKEVNGGLKDAYVAARWLALQFDTRTPNGPPGSRESEFGVEWAIRRKRPDE